MVASGLEVKSIDKGEFWGLSQLYSNFSILDVTVQAGLDRPSPRAVGNASTAVPPARWHVRKIKNYKASEQPAAWLIVNCTSMPDSSLPQTTPVSKTVDSEGEHQKTALGPPDSSQYQQDLCHIQQVLSEMGTSRSKEKSFGFSSHKDISSGKNAQPHVDVSGSDTKTVIDSKAFTVLKIKSSIDKKPTTLDEKSSAVFKYRTPHFRSVYMYMQLSRIAYELWSRYVCIQQQYACGNTDRKVKTSCAYTTGVATYITVYICLV